MSIRTSKLLVQLVDGVTGPARTVANSLATMNKAIAGTSIAGSVLGGNVAALQKHQQLIAAQSRSVAQGLATTAFAAGGFAMALTGPIRGAMQFSRTMTSIQQKLNGTAETMAMVELSIKEISSSLNLDLVATAEAFDQAVGAGLDPLANPRALEVASKLAKAYSDRSNEERVQLLDAIKLTRSLSQNSEIKNSDLMRAVDMLAEMGKSGSFEVADMSKEFPKLTASMQARGFTGLDAVKSLGAALQVTRRTAATSEIAANDLYNLLTKADSEETRKKFKKLGIDIRAELKKTKDAGGDIFETMIAAINKATKGDQSKIGDIFQDMQAQNAARALVQFAEEYRKFKKIGQDAGKVIETDLNRRLKDSASVIDDFGIALKNTTKILGDGLMIELARLIRATGLTGESMARWAERNSEIAGKVALLTGGLIAGRVAFLGLRMAALGLRGAMVAALVPVAALSGALRGLAVSAVTARGALFGIAATLGRIARFGLALGGIAAIGTTIYQNWSRLGEFFRSFGESFMLAIGPLREPIESLGNSLSNLTSKLTFTKEQFIEWGGSLGQAVGSGIVTVVNAINSIVSALNSVVSAAGNALSALRGLGGISIPSVGGPAAGTAPMAGTRASGGSVLQGLPYLVGERGPEIFVPSAGGRIERISPLPRIASVQPSGRQQTFNLNVSINAPVSTQTNINELRDLVHQKIQDGVTEAFRGIQADAGLRFS
jgi:flagellar motility protein MotE (MotC chaperone)